LKRLLVKKGRIKINARCNFRGNQRIRCRRCRCYFQLKELFAVELEKTQTSKLFEDIEIPLVPVLAAMETEGINLDVPFLKSMSAKCKIDTFEQKYMKLRVRNSTIIKTIGRYSFDKLK
jgi:DNA polymerase-1